MDINKVFSIINRRLSNIVRYNNTPKIISENVAEHSFFVTFYVMILGDLIENLNIEKALELALIHDIEESISGDIPHNIKQKYPFLNKSLEDMNLLIASEIFENNNKYVSLWKEERAGITLESKLVLFADILSGYLYTRNELAMGNIFMQEINLEQKNRLIQMLDDTIFYRIKKELLL